MRSPELRAKYIKTIEAEIEFYKKRVKEASMELEYWQEELMNIDNYSPEELLYEQEYCKSCGKRGSYKQCCYSGHY